MTPFEHGYKDAILKLATSRWREAVRSGEIAGPEAEALKARMGVDPAREAEGLVKGWKGKARAQGYRAYENISPVQMASSAAQRKLEGSSSPVAQKARELLRKATGKPLRQKDLKKQFEYLTQGGMLSPAAVHPELRVTGAVPSLEPSIFGNLSAKDVKNYVTDSKFRKQLRSALLGHEGSEISAFTRNPGINFRVLAGGPAGEYSAFSGGATAGLLRRIHGQDEPVRQARQFLLETPLGGAMRGMHADPQVLLEELRNTRMLDPKVQAAMKSLRKGTGEWRMMEEALGEGMRVGRKGKALQQARRAMSGAAEAGAANLGKSFDIAAKSPMAALKRLALKAVRRGK